MSARFKSRNGRPGHSRRGAAVAYVAVTLTVLLGFVALGVDVGLLYSANAELQRTSDASALTAAWEMLHQNRLKGPDAQAEVFEAARQEATNLAEINPVFHDGTIVHPYEDVLIGHWSQATGFVMAVSAEDFDAANAAAVAARRDPDRVGSISLAFARILGFSEQALRREAVAAFEDGVIGFKITDPESHAELLPFTLHRDYYAQLANDAPGLQDLYTFDPATGLVHNGPDGIPELNLYPGAGADQLPPGNFGTVDIGSPDNSTQDISRQILEGVNAEDLEYYGGEFKLGPDGTIDVTGDTGLSAGIKDELIAIKGKPRAIPLFKQVSGHGNNSVFTIVDFGGIRIMSVKLNGKMRSKKVVVQPAIVVDGTTVTGDIESPSQNIYRPARLVQ